MGSVGKIIGTVTGGLLGSQEVPEVKYQKPREIQKGDADPNRAEELAASRKRSKMIAARKGRNSFRIDMTGGLNYLDDSESGGSRTSKTISGL
ncbi:MAG: hypothetical protein GWN58_53815 [Anaerolineae bacterium]|nr:hypothetical protein [Anaerolineae bacterium]